MLLLSIRFFSVSFIRFPPADKNVFIIL